MELNVQKRTELGKKSKKLRAQRKLPGVVYGKGLESLPITLDLLPFEKVYKEAGESTLVDVVLGSDKFKVLISEVSVHPVTDELVHVNLHKVNLKEKIKAAIPIKIVGESELVKSGGGLLLELIHEIGVEALPTDLLHAIEVDITNLKAIGDHITIAQLPIDRTKIEILGHDEEDLVVKIDFAEMKEEVAAVEPVSEEELVAKVEATAQLTEEEKTARAAEDKAKKEKDDKK